MLSAERLLAMTGMPQSERAAFLRRHRPDNIHLVTGSVIRHQRPMPPALLAPALQDGLEPGDWYALLNAHVFLWPGLERLERQRRSCGSRPQVMLTFDAAMLLERLGDQAAVSPINSGNARRRPSPRSGRTLMQYRDWVRDGWPSGQRWRLPAEFLFRCVVPVDAACLLDVREV